MSTRLNFVTNVLTSEEFDQWVEDNIINTPRTVLAAIKANILNSANLPTLEEYHREEKTFHALYGADENRAAVLSVLNSLKK